MTSSAQQIVKSHPNRLSQLQPGEAILSLLAHAKLLVLARWCGSPQGVLRKAGDLLAVMAMELKPQLEQREKDQEWLCEAHRDGRVLEHEQRFPQT